MKIDPEPAAVERQRGVPNRLALDLRHRPWVGGNIGRMVRQSQNDASHVDGRDCRTRLTLRLVLPYGETAPIDGNPSGRQSLLEHSPCHWCRGETAVVTAPW